MDGRGVTISLRESFISKFLLNLIEKKKLVYNYFIVLENIINIYLCSWPDIYKPTGFNMQNKLGLRTCMKHLVNNK